MSWPPKPAPLASGRRLPEARTGRRLRAAQRGLSLGGAGVVWLLLVAPIVALIAHLSPSAISTALRAPGALDPLVVSLESGGVTLAVLLVGGLPLGWLLARGRLPLHRLWETGILCALLMPPLAIGLLLVFLVGPDTPAGHTLAALHLGATNTLVALVIAEIYESAPYFVLGVQAAFGSVDPQLEQQAWLLGDPPRTVVRRVTLPLAAPGIAMALAVAWARAMGAFGAVIIIAYHPYGLPLQIWTTLQETGLASALPFALVLLVVALPLPILAYAWSVRARARRHG